MKNRRHRFKDPAFARVCAAFGAGVLLSLFCSFKLVAVLAAVFLILLAIRCGE